MSNYTYCPMEVDMINDFLNGEALIRCDEEYKAVALIKILRELGYTWQDGDTLNKTEWDWFYENSCYGIDEEGVFIMEYDMCKHDCTIVDLVKSK